MSALDADVVQHRTAALALAPVRAELREFAGYSSARREASGGSVWLNANENPWPPAGDGGLALNRYPDPQPVELLRALADLYGVAPAQVLVGRGSDEAIDLLVRACCRAREDAVLVCPPTFGMYAVSARIQDAELLSVPLQPDPLRGFAPDLPALLPAIARRGPRLVFACSPNNPTGASWSAGELAAVANALAGRGLLVVDEAYAEFDGDGAGALALLPRHANLVVLRTLSKAHALAGARLGVALGDPGLLAVLRAIMAPYPVPTTSLQAARHALRPDALARTRAQLALLCRERTRLATALQSLPCVREVMPSQANFLCVRFADAMAVHAHLLGHGIVARDVSRQPGLGQCLRLTVGSCSDNDLLLEALALVPAGARRVEVAR